MFQKIRLITGVGLRYGSRTALYDLHLERGAKMAEFGGFDMPMSYQGVSVPDSVLLTRNHATVFDVSHMLQTVVTGRHAIDFMESLCVTDIHGLGVGKSALSLFLHSKTGGILDDLVLTKTSEDSLYVVSNAGRRGHDSRLMLRRQEEMKRNGKEVEVSFLEEQALVAVQGPQSSAAVSSLLGMDLSTLWFMESTLASFEGSQLRVTRCGYTGEDGFEISVPSPKATDMVNKLFQIDPKLRLAGLAARDTLRLEAGLCLYGSDIDARITPVEAGLMWTIGKKRKEKADFPGAEAVLSSAKAGASLKRVGLSGPPGRVARGGCHLSAPGGGILGRVTSGAASPCLKLNLAMGYLPAASAAPGTQLLALLSPNTQVPLTVTKMPFVPSHYFTKPKNSKE